MKEIIILTSTYYKPHFGGVENSLFFLAKEYIKSIEDKTTYIKYKEALRVFRKVKYS